MSGDLAAAVADFLAHKRALGRKYRSEEATLRPARRLRRPAGRELSSTSSTPALLDGSSPPGRGRDPAASTISIGIVGCFFDWAVSQQLLASSPLQASRRRERPTRRLPFLFDPAQARQLLDGRGRPAGQRPGPGARADLSCRLRSLLWARAARG